MKGITITGKFWAKIPERIHLIYFQSDLKETIQCITHKA
jgi:hypothetical protein